MKNKIARWLCMLLPTALATAQNPYWVFPPNYIDFKTNQVLPLPTGSSYTKATDNISNGFFSQGGSCKFTTKMSAMNNHCYSNGITTMHGNMFMSTENLLIPSLSECDEYYLLDNGLIVSEGGGPNPLGLGRKIKLESSAYRINSSNVQYTSFGTTARLVSSAVSHPRAINNNNVVFDLYTLSNDGSGYYKLGKTVYTYDTYNSGVTSSTAYSPLATFYDFTFVSEMDLSRDERYLSWGDMNTGKLFIFDLVTSSLSTLNVAPATRVYGVEFSKNSNYLYFTKYSYSGINPGIGVYNLKTGLFEADVPLSASCQYSQLELAIDGNIYAYDGTQLKGFDSEKPSLGFTKSFTISNPLSSLNIYIASVNLYTLVDQIDNLDYSKTFKYYSCKPVEYLSGTISGTKTYSASVSANNVGTTNVSNASLVNVTAGSYITLESGFNTSLTSSGYFRAAIQACGTPVGISCASYRKENELHNDDNSAAETLIYPNPITSGLLNFSKTAESFKLVNMSGIEVLNGSNVDKINVDGLSKGLYLLHIDGKAMKVVIE